ncbi:MAG: hypothetical protein QXN68_00475 [Thermoplasmata archaeon]
MATYEFNKTQNFLSDLETNLKKRFKYVFKEQQEDTILFDTLIYRFRIKESDSKYILDTNCPPTLLKYFTNLEPINL